MTLRSRMAVTAVTATAAALSVVLLLAGPALKRRALTRTRDVLLAEARLMAQVVDRALEEGADLGTLDPEVDEAARAVRARVTIVAPDGRVLADSAASGPQLRALDNHGTRPEVLAALAGGEGTSLRRSATLGQDLLYVAVPIRRQGRLLGVSRMALSVEDLEEQARELRGAVMAALGVAFVVTALLSIGLSASLAGPLRSIMDAARAFAAGNLTARSRVSRGDELGELARILNQSADQLQARLTEIARDRARTEAILASMEDGVLAVDNGGRVLVANRALCRSLGLQDPIGRPYLEAIRHREIAQLLEGILAGGERRAAEVELPHLRRLFVLSGAPFPGSQGSPPGAVLTFHDATERRSVERVRRDFVANASHELRTPLTSIRGFVEALEDGALADPELARRFLGKIRTHAERMTTLVGDLLELSRIESGERLPQWQEVAPGQVVEEVAESLADLAERRVIRLSHEDRGAPAVVTDPERLRLILHNLVENAIKYTVEAGQVAVWAEAGPEGSAHLEVEDNGPGIAEEHLGRIFERFYRVDKARSRELGGTGLGLAIVKHAAEGMGAQVAVASVRGQGSRFTLTLPADGRNPGQAAGTVEAPGENN